MTRALALAIPILLLTASAASAADAILIDDFNDGNDGGWDHDRYNLADRPFGPAIFDASSGEYRMASTGLIRDLEEARDGVVSASWAASSSDPLFYSHGLFRFPFRIDGNGTSFEFAMRAYEADADSDADSWSFYAFGADSSANGGAFSFRRAEAGVSEHQLVAFNQPHLHEKWMLEAGAIGDKLTMKWWPVGAPEPNDPQWEWIDPDPLPPGIFGTILYLSTGAIEDHGIRPPWSIDATIDDLYFMPADGVGARVSLRAGDADQDLDFDQMDLVQVQVAAKYLTGQSATWGEGDWDGAPGGLPGDPPAGDGLFNQFDIIAAQQGAAYLAGPYAAIQPKGQRGDGQTSVVYDPDSGELSVDAPTGVELTSINIDSAAGVFTGQAAQNLGGSFDNDADNNIFKATFGSSFGSLSFGNVVQAGLSEQFVLDDLSVVGSLAGGGELGDVDLVYVPEPSSALLLALGLAIGLLRFGRIDH